MNRIFRCKLGWRRSLQKIPARATCCRSTEQLSAGGATNRHDCVALSSNCSKEAVWMRQITTDLRKGPAIMTTIFEDNQLVISMTKSPQFHGSAKHITYTVSLGSKLIVALYS